MTGIAPQYPLAAEATTASTRYTYSAALRRFFRWCQANQRHPLPASPETVAAYLEAQHRDGAALGSLKKWRSAISTAHRAAGYESPCTSLLVEHTLRGAARHSEPTKQAPALRIDALRTLVAASTGPKATLDRAVLLVGFFGGLRGDDLGGLTMESIEWTHWGCVLSVRGKTERGNEVRRVPLGFREDELCPCSALRAWIHERATRVKPQYAASLFGCWERPSDGSNGGKDLVTRILQRAAKAAGLPCAYSSHSLRAGFVTEAHASGISDHDIMATTGHRTPQVLSGYVREASLEKRCATARIGG